MSDVVRELSELKKEIVEARNQGIKTDNQVKNMALDVKSFEKRFDALERRTRVASVGVHAIVALTIAGAAAVVTTMRSGSYDEEIRAVKKEAGAVSAKAQKKEQELATRLREFEQRKQLREQSQSSALEIMNLLEQKKDKEATALLPKVKLEALTPLENKLVGKRFKDLRRRTAESAYKSGRSLLTAKREEQAIAEFDRALALEPEGPYEIKARYLLGTTLFHLERFDQAEGHLRKLLETSDDKVLRDEVRFMLGVALARLGKRDEAKKQLEAAAVGGYRNSARLYLNALESGGPLPGDGDGQEG